MNNIAWIFTHMWQYLNSHEFLQIVMSSRFLLILLVVMLSYLRHLTYRSMFLAAITNIPGTFFHELMHFTVGLLLYAKPTTFCLFPKKVGDGYVMGSVGFRNIKFYNAVPSALAPLLLLVIAYYLDKMFLQVTSITNWGYLLYILLQTILIENSIPSPADLRIARRSVLGIILYLCLFLFVVLFLNHRF